MKRVYTMIMAISIPLVVIVIVLSMLSAAPVQAAPPARPLHNPGDCVVTNTNDSGADSLRICIAQLAPGDTITFSTSVFSTTNPATIALINPLPIIVTNAITIDGSSAGVILNGSGTSGGANGLDINGASNVTIKGLQILNFSGSGVNIRNGAINNTLGGTNTNPGGPCSGDCNLISGNSGMGVSIEGSGTISNTVSGNYIGTDISGLANLGNGVYGVNIANGAKYNVIGGTTEGERNIISGQTNSDGVWIGGAGSAYNVVIGNYIGTDVSGTQAIPNGNDGIDLAGGAMFNRIGGTIAGERNLVSGNGWNGVSMGGSVMSNTVIGNYIGTDINGTAAISNTNNGVSVGNGASYNYIGGDTASKRNLISGNAKNGVEVDGDYNVVSGNFIGVNISSTATVPNGEAGVSLVSKASYNTIGGDAPGECNIISGNFIGVHIIGANRNVVSGNYIGTDVSGLIAIPNTSTIRIWAGAQYNTIGGDTPGERNLINRGVAIVGSGTDHNVISGNYIGLDANGTAALGNSISGVTIELGASQNTIGISNTIAFNGGDGVQVYGSNTLSNTITRNSIYSNTSQGIQLSNGGNTKLPAPVLGSADANSGIVTGKACAFCTIEVFSDDEDEGRVYEGTTTANANGDWTFNKGSSLTGPHFTATATDAGGNTSEFGQFKVFLPIILKDN
ncbi:MAG: hypothetical protein GY869_15920 [Planctomycetes bacterium]|nr:hypothetical protein [Planctomycetota bacterium]